MQFWTVLEIQGNADGSKGVLATAYDDYEHALSAYYGVLSSAAISPIPYHAAYLIDSQRGVKKSEVFDRSVDNG